MNTDIITQPLEPGNVQTHPPSGARRNASSQAGSYASIHYLASVGDAQGLNSLLSRGAPVDAADKDSNTPLHWAVQKGTPSTIRLLVENYNAALNCQNMEGNTPLHVAILANHNLELVEYLITRGADSNVPNVDGQTALHLAVIANAGPLVELLLNSGAFIQVQDDEGDSPLHYAVRECRYDIAKFLVNRGANMNLKNEDEESPRDLAHEFADEVLLNLFRENDVRVQISSDNFEMSLTGNSLHASNMTTLSTSADTLMMSTSPSMVAFQQSSFQASPSFSNNWSSTQPLITSGNDGIALHP